MSPRILFVDDERSVLEAIRRRHRKQYDLVTACGPVEGLRAVELEGPFAVVVTDYNMPELNGTEFLERIHEAAPDTVRIMLTGQADMQVAIESVNKGRVFRFLTKPCEPEELQLCIDAGLEQWRLRNAERLLLEQTVKGSIGVLVDVLSLSNPSAFGKAQRIRQIVAHVVRQLGLRNAWQYETAALLSHLGCVSVPDDLLDRVAAGEALPPAQLSVFERHPQVAHDLIGRIPRLQVVAQIVARQQNCEGPHDDKAVVLGGRILAAALEFEECLSVGATKQQALDVLGRTPNKFGQRVLDALASFHSAGGPEDAQAVTIRQLRVGMTLREDICNKDGNLVVGSGHEVTEGVLRRLHNYAELDGLDKKVVRVDMTREDEGNERSADVA